MPGQISLKELARILGLSESTVSKALNDRPDVSVSVKQRVQEAAQQLGYAPNPAARTLAMGKSAVIGVFLLNRFNRPAGEYFGFNFLGGLMKEAQNRGCDLMIFQESEEANRIGYLEYARQRGTAAAILIGLWPDDVQLQELAQDRWPWVAIDTPIPGSARGFISTDNRQAMNCALQAVYDKGHRKIGFIGIHGGGYVGTERHAAFTEFCRERNLDSSSPGGRHSPECRIRLYSGTSITGRHTQAGCTCLCLGPAGIGSHAGSPRTGAEHPERSFRYRL